MQEIEWLLDELLSQQVLKNCDIILLDFNQVVFELYIDSIPGSHTAESL